MQALISIMRTLRDSLNSLLDVDLGISSVSACKADLLNNSLSHPAGYEHTGGRVAVELL